MVRRTDCEFFLEVEVLNTSAAKLRIANKSDTISIKECIANFEFLDGQDFFVRHNDKRIFVKTLARKHGACDNG